METLEAPIIALEGDNPSMTLADAQQQRLLERLREGAATSRSLLPSCTPAGIDFPAAVISELELNGYVIERVYTRRTPAAPAAPIAGCSTSRDHRGWPGL